MMDDATKADYLRASEALARHDGSLCPTGEAAFLACYDSQEANTWEGLLRIDNRAARLLRECIAKNEELK